MCMRCRCGGWSLGSKSAACGGDQCSVGAIRQYTPPRPVRLVDGHWLSAGRRRRRRRVDRGRAAQAWRLAIGVLVRYGGGGRVGVAHCRRRHRRCRARTAVAALQPRRWKGAGGFDTGAHHCGVSVSRRIQLAIRGLRHGHRVVGRCHRYCFCRSSSRLRTLLEAGGCGLREGQRQNSRITHRPMSIHIAAARSVTSAAQLAAKS